MDKATVSFNTPKAGKITISLGTDKAILLLGEYSKMVPRTKNPDNFFKDLKKNIRNYFVGLK